MARTTLKHDKDGFLIGRGGKPVLEDILNNTDETLERLKRLESMTSKTEIKVRTQTGKVTKTKPVQKSTQAEKNPPVKKVRHTAAVKQPKESAAKNVSGRPKTTADKKWEKIKKEKAQSIGANATPPAPKPERLRGANGQYISSKNKLADEKNTRKDRQTALAEAKTQTKILNKILKKEEQSSGLFKWLPFLGTIASFLPGFMKLPFMAGGGAAKGLGRLLGFGGKSAGAAGLLGRGLKGVAKGGLLAVLLAAFEGVTVESNNQLSRGQKNKEHFKNLLSAVGGVGGAMAGAALGQAVIPIPVVGAVIGGLLGGFGGSELTRAIADHIDSLIPPEIGDEMFTSWQGFINGATYLWGNLTANASASWNGFTNTISDAGRWVWYNLIPDQVAAYYLMLWNAGKGAWDSFSSFINPYWENVSSFAKSTWESVASLGKVFWGEAGKLFGGFIESISNAFSGVWDAIKENPVVKGITGAFESAYNTVTDTFKSAYNTVTNAYDNAVQQHRQNEAEYRTENPQSTVGNLAQRGMQAISGMLGFDMTKKYDHIKYGMGSKNLKSGAIDCSGWNFQVSKMEMESLNNMYGYQKYKTTKNTAGILNAGTQNAATQIGVLSRQHGVITDSRNKGGFDISKLQAGMSIGQFSRTSPYKGNIANVAGYGNTRYNHIVKVVRGHDGKLYISESRGGKNGGVTLTDANQWVQSRRKNGDTLTAVSAFDEQDLAALNGSPVAVAKATAKKAVGKVLNAIVPSAQAGELPSKGWRLGNTSKQFETSGRGAGTISNGKGDKGGISYGSYQLSSNLGVVQKFLKESGYQKHFNGMAINSSAFKNQWTHLAKYDKAFEAAQHDYIKRTHYAPLMNKLKKSGIDLSKRSAAIQDMVWSTSVQFGGGTSLINKALKGKDVAQMTDAEIIRAVQKYKYDNNDILFKSSSEKDRKGTKLRAEKEEQALLQLLQREGVPYSLAKPIQVAETEKVSNTQQPPAKIARYNVPATLAAQQNMPTVNPYRFESYQAKPESVASIKAPSSIQRTNQQKLAQMPNVGNRIAHTPQVGRYVGHPRIAHIISGGLMDA